MLLSFGAMQIHEKCAMVAFFNHSRGVFLASVPESRQNPWVQGVKYERQVSSQQRLF